MFQTVLLLLLTDAGAQTAIASEIYQDALSLKLNKDFQAAYAQVLRADSILGIIPGESPELFADVAYLHGILAYNLSRFEEGFRALVKADSLFEVTENNGGRADSRLFMGNCVWYMAGGQAALPYFDEAISYAEQDYPGRRNYRGRYYLDKGYALAESGSFQEAFRWIEKGKKLDLEYYGPVSEPYAQALMVSAVAHKFVGDYYLSVLMIEQALDVLKKAGKTDDGSVAPLFGNLANICFNMADLDESEHYSYKALEAFNNVLPEGNYNSVSLYINLGNICSNKNQPASGLEWYEKAAPYVDKSSDPNTYHALQYGRAICLNALGRLVEADSIYRLAEGSTLDTYGPTDIGTAIFYINFANNLMGLDSLEAAINALDKAEQIETALFGAGHIMQSEIPAIKGSYFWQKEQPDIALLYAREGLQYFDNLTRTQIADFRNTYQVLNYLHARCLKKLPDSSVEAALDNYKAIESLQDYLLNAERSMDDRMGSMEDRNNLYREMADTYCQTGKTDEYKKELWRIAEKSKALILLDGVRRARIPELEPALDSIQRTTVAYNFYRKKLSESSVSNNQDLKIQWENRAFDVEIQRRSLWNELRVKNPQLAHYFDPASQTVSLSCVRDSLLAPGQALLEYFTGEKAVYAFFVNADTALVHEIPLDFPLEDWIDQLRQGLYGYYAAPDSAQTPELLESTVRKYLRYAPLLYEKLVKPLKPLLPERLVIVPDGPIGYIPFDALLTGYPRDISNFKGYDFLLKRHQISYSYSATLLREMRDKSHKQLPQNNFVAFAPFFEGNPGALKNMYQLDELLRSELTPLPYSGAEVAAAAKLMNGDIVAGRAATEEKFCSVAARYRIIHLSTHGKADNRLGDHAFLAFAEVPDSLENELLFVRELYNLSLNADLVVLSACETGTGKLQRGEGIISVARAFAYAGAKSIVTSLWEVNDQSTAELTRHFYRELRAGSDKDEALRKARLRYIRETSVRQAHPFFWAAFQCVGDMRPLSK